MTLEIELGCTGGEGGVVQQPHGCFCSVRTQPEDVDYAYAELSKIGPRFTIAASFGNVHGVYKPGNVVLTPTSCRDSQGMFLKHNLPLTTLNFVFPRRFRFYCSGNQRLRKLRRSENEHRYRYRAAREGVLNYYKAKRICKVSWATRRRKSAEQNTMTRAYGCVLARRFDDRSSGKSI